MKKTTLVTTAAGLALAFGLSACSDAEMAQTTNNMNQQTQNSQSMIDAERDCKVYVANKFSLPMAAMSVSKGYTISGRTYIPVIVKWDKPYVNEKGECTYVNGRTASYTVKN